MKKITIAIALFISAVSVQAQTKSNTTANTENTGDDQESLAKTYLSQIMGVALNATSNLKLFEAVHDWIGTPYRFGGSSRKGIDCSGFTKEIYSKVFNLTIKRNSRDIFSMVSPVRRNELKEGDLVFFKIRSRRISHVGVYLGGGRFAHASSRGVAISNLEDRYYSRYFYKGGRLTAQYQEELEIPLEEETN
ncbi:NlpC/P60 family protein [Mucilaginibacter roseus]|uniref:NlpC/P60 family protein n=1 Tax=Mucilaginibacter roseus TaxID=1528868 RepID=A0ABS8U6G4_9SPHI|nr:NlpC/P60 family protein [Mucilaginibacter roseus]MCD8741113.1 NlpC/P60 family protein [Mucilaginibacter roseus]